MTQQIEQPLTCDGCPFVIGMTVVLPSGREITTTDADHELEKFEMPVGTVWLLKRRNSTVSTDTRHFYSSQRARIDDQVKRLEEFKTRIDDQIALLKSDVRGLGTLYLEQTAPH